MVRRARRCAPGPPLTVARTSPCDAGFTSRSGRGPDPVHARGQRCRGAYGGGGRLRAPDRSRRAVSGQPLHAARGALRRRSADAVRPGAAGRFAAVRSLRRRRRQPLPGALPAPGGPRGVDRADQGNASAGGTGIGAPGRARCAPGLGQGRRRARDDRRSDAQRPGAGMRVRKRASGATTNRGPRGRLASGLDRVRPAARRGGRRRAATREFPARLGDRGAQGPGDEGDRHARGHPSRGVHRGDRHRLADRGARPQRRDPHVRVRTRCGVVGRGGGRGGRLRPAGRAGRGIHQGGRSDRRDRGSPGPGGAAPRATSAVFRCGRSSTASDPIRASACSRPCSSSMGVPSGSSGI